ncbi:MAG: zinc ribbon domain-containing protein [Pseudoflavonifractor sp.]
MDDRVKELLDRVRDTAVSVSEVAGTTARYAGKCAGQMVDVAKLNMKIFDLKAETTDLLREIGGLVYDAHLGKAGDQTAMDAILLKIDENRRDIDEVKDRIAVLKNTRACPHCGAACGKDDKFCKDCGGALDA